jgi:hypothetical protein
MFKKTITQVSVVNNENLYFLVFDKQGKPHIVDSFPLDNFLTRNKDVKLISEKITHKANSLMILPDFWFGYTSYDFQSKKRSLSEAFVERKLQADYPHQPEIKYFFEHTFYQKTPEEQGIYAYFLQEPRSFRLYNELAAFNLHPRRITIPALLWKEKLNRLIPDFNQGGKALVHVLPSECFLYFFSQGQFLFSRNIRFPGAQKEDLERFKDLVYEINQSLHLFSQKANSQIDTIFVPSGEILTAEDLSNMLGKEVKKFAGLEGRGEHTVGLSEFLGPIECFSSYDFSHTERYLSLSHKLVKKELEWKPVIVAGIGLGLLVLLLLGAENFFIRSWPLSNQFGLSAFNALDQTPSRQVIEQYNDALGAVILERRRPMLSKTIAKIVTLLPDDVWIESMIIDYEASPPIDFTGIVRASGPDQFKATLTVLLNNINKLGHGSLVQLQDVDFEIDKRKIETGYQYYKIKFNFDVP